MKYKKYDQWFGWLDRWLDRQAEKRIGHYIEKHATREDGSIAEKLARRITWEVGRRAETGKQLDVYEPMRWTGIRAVLGALGTAAAKLIEARYEHGETQKRFFGFVKIGIISSTLISGTIDLLRLYPRWLAGLEGGKNTALKL